MMALLLCLLVLGCALGVVGSQNPLYAALWLIATLCGVACCFGWLQVSLLAAMQLLVYAGAIMVLFLFVIMMLQLGPDPVPMLRYWPVASGLAMVALAYLTWRLLAGLWAHQGPVAMPVMPNVDASMLGAWFLQQDVLVFELVSILLLTAIVSSCVLGLRGKA